MFFFFKQKTAYAVRISDWSSDVCSSDLPHQARRLYTMRERLGELLRADAGSAKRRIQPGQYGQRLRAAPGIPPADQVRNTRPALGPRRLGSDLHAQVSIQRKPPGVALPLFHNKGMLSCIRKYSLMPMVS